MDIIKICWLTLAAVLLVIVIYFYMVQMIPRVVKSDLNGDLRKQFKRAKFASKLIFPFGPFLFNRQFVLLTCALRALNIARPQDAWNAAAEVARAPFIQSDGRAAHTLIALAALGMNRVDDAR